MKRAKGLLYPRRAAQSLKTVIKAALAWSLRPVHLALARRYSPTMILDITDQPESVFRCVDKGPVSYVVADVSAGAVFTDRRHNVTVLKQGGFNKIARRGFYLPSGMALKDEQIDRVAEALSKIFQEV